MSKDISLTKVLKALSDQKTQKLFAAIIRAEAAKSQPLIGDLGLTRRQYYSKINDLLKTGLIRRHGGKYRVSSFGKVIHSLQKTAERTASSYWKLEAIDRIKMSDNSKLKEADRMKIMALK